MDNLNNTQHSATSTDNSSSTWVPALRFQWATPLYQTIVELFCRDDYVKKQLLNCIQGQHNLKILDVACGPGKLPRLLAQQQGPCCHITGIDIDPEMVAKASEETKQYSLNQQITILQGDCTKLHELFAPATFDVVIESLMFHHLTDSQKRAAVAEIKRVLKPGGVFYFVDWVKPESLYSKVAFNIVKILDGVANVASHENNHVIHIIEEAGGFKLLERQAQLIETSVGTIAILSFTPVLA